MHWDSIPADLRLALLALVREAVRPAVADALADALPEVVRRAALPEYLTRREVCDLLGWSDRKLSYEQAKPDGIPFIKRGRTVRFRTADVEKYLMAGFVPARKTDEVA